MATKNYAYYDSVKNLTDTSITDFNNFREGDMIEVKKGGATIIFKHQDLVEPEPINQEETE